MTKKRQERVRVWHPAYKAEAHPPQADLKTWIEKGWQVQPETKEQDE